MCAGKEDQLKIVIDHSHKVALSFLGVYSFQKRKATRCDQRLTYERVIARLNRHIRGETRTLGNGVGDAFAALGVSDLTILNEPYNPSP